jgi:hypothetical protein
MKPRSFIPSSTTIEGDKILYEAVSKPNRWGYTLFKAPDFDDNGLTYWLEASVHFRNKRIQSTDEAEQLFMDIYEDFLHKLNAVRAIRPFLAHFPLTPSTFSLGMGFNDEQGTSLLPPCISAIYLWNNVLDFKRFVPMNFEDPGLPHRVFFSKPIAEIERMNKLFTPVLPKTIEREKPKVPTLTKLSWNCETPLGNAEFDLMNKYCEKNNLHLLVIGGIGKDYIDSPPFGAALMGRQLITLEEARLLSSQFGNIILHFAQTNRHCIALMEERSKDKFWKDTATKAEPRHIAFRISFWDENIDRISPPHIAEIRVLRDTISYFTADEYQRLVLIHEASLSNILKNAFDKE